jgi:glyoxylase-like metal-dependent hydrolase (beta-lactamase superfamily II)
MRAPADDQLANQAAVGSEGYRFGLGEFECLALSDGVVRYPPRHLFANVPTAQVEKVLRQRHIPVTSVATPLTHLWVSAEGQQVLVDVGAGGLAPGTGKLPQRMIAAGLKLAAIDIVIITHAHPTHVGGMLDQHGRPLYVNARYYVWQTEWDFWTSDRAFARAPERHVAVARHSLEAVRDRLIFLDQEDEILPGVGIISAPGHTPGHAAVSLSSRGERLLYLSDAVFHALHLEHPDWQPIYDILPQRAAESKRRILDLAAEQEALVIGQHFAPFPSLGHVIRADVGWRWQQIEMRPGQLDDSTGNDQ